MNALLKTDLFMSGADNRIEHLPQLSTAGSTVEKLSAHYTSDLRAVFLTDEETELRYICDHIFSFQEIVFYLNKLYFLCRLFTGYFVFTDFCILDHIRFV